eukprot:19324-Heterococcus_DN1.PRE.2
MQLAANCEALHEASRLKARDVEWELFSLAAASGWKRSFIVASATSYCKKPSRCNATCEHYKTVELFDVTFFVIGAAALDLPV